MLELDQYLHEQFSSTTDSLTIEECAYTDAMGRIFVPARAGDRLPDLSLILREAACEVGVEMEARSSGWVVHMKRSVFQATASGAILAVALKIATGTGISVLLLPAIIPLLFQVERTSLSLADERLLLVLHRSGAMKGSAKDLYQALPKGVRRSVNDHDFLNFLDRVQGTGHAKVDESMHFELSHPDHPRLCIRII